MELIKRYKWALIITGGLLCTALIVTGIYITSLDPPAIRKALAAKDYSEALNLYSSLMVEEPTGRTAGKMIDSAIALDNSSKLFQALKVIFPYLEVKGVKKPFIQGGVVWLKGTKELNEDVRWLTEQLVLNGVDVTQQIRTIYVSTYAPQTLLAWSGWVSQVAGMDADCLNVLAKGSIRHISVQPWPDPEQPNSSDELLLQAQSLLTEAGAASELLDLWLNWHLITEAELADRVTAITPPTAGPEAQVYWLLRALVVTRPLGDGWEHPLDVDVMAELPTVYPNLALIHRQAFSQIMYDKVKSGPLNKLTYLVEVIDPADISLKSPEQAVKLLHTLADNDVVSDFVKSHAKLSEQPPVMPLLSEFWSCPAALKLAPVFWRQWEDNNELQVWSDIASATARVAPPALDVVNQKVYEEITFPLYTSWSHPVLVFRDSRGVIMFDLEQWQERVLPGNICALSPDGSRLVTLEWQDASSEFRIFDMTGTQLDSFTLDLDLRPRVDKHNWKPVMDWSVKEQLHIFYFGGEGYNPPFEDSYCSIEIASRQYKLSKKWIPYDDRIPLAPGVYRDYNWNLYDEEDRQIGLGGTRLAEGQDPQYDSFGFENNQQLNLRDGKLWFVSAGAERDITPADTTVDYLQFAAATEETIYMQLGCPPYWSEWETIYRYSPATGVMEKLAQPAWQQHFADNREDNSMGKVLVPDGKGAPLIFDHDYNIDVYAHNSRYYFVACHWRPRMYGQFELVYPLMLYSLKEGGR